MNSFTKLLCIHVSTYNTYSVSTDKNVKKDCLSENKSTRSVLYRKFVCIDVKT